MKFSNATGRAALIIFLAIAILVGISFMPLERWSGGAITDFNLFSDILNLPDRDEAADSTSVEGMDPELAALIMQGEQAPANDTTGVSATAASINDTIPEYVDTDTVIPPVRSNRVGQTIAIEDYTTGSRGMSRLKNAIRAGRLARVAMVGDSYIEGDIFCQDLRLNLQNAYGGEGVGYVNMQTEFAGFRRTVKQSGSGWTDHTALKKGNGSKAYFGLSEQYFNASSSASSTYKGVGTIPHLDTWSRSRFLFVAPNNTTISVKTSIGDWQQHQVTGAEGVQCLLVNEQTSEFAIKVTDPKLIGLGVWLDSGKGVSVDCMSSRGFSGITLTGISTSLCRAMGRDINYDLIILEFGINAMSPGQTNYSIYSNRMVEVINHVRTCYPDADILLLGIGDRGQKKGGDIHSMKGADEMVTAQRDAARRAHCLFWDTREAMGGADAIVAWSQQKLVNKDYIHLTHEGGKKLAGLLFDAMQLMLK